MPKKGFKTITVKENVYDFLWNEYQQVKEEYAIKKGIRSFSGYISYRLSQLMEQEKQRNP